MPYAVVVYEVGGVDFVVVEGAGKDKGNRERVVEGAKGIDHCVKASSHHLLPDFIGKARPDQQHFRAGVHFPFGFRNVYAGQQIHVLFLS